MEKPKTLLEALEKSQEHWIDLIERYSSIKSNPARLYIYSDSCPLCQFLQTNCYNCPLKNVKVRSCCLEWINALNAWGTYGFIPAAWKMVERLNKEIMNKLINTSHPAGRR
ncbi:MAG: hypothetical protein WC441_04770 [Patescibacteria group bacterium]